MQELMTVNGREFSVIRLLGKGKGGYSYLVTDGTQDYVLKQIHHEPCDCYRFGERVESELRDYRRLKERGIRLPALLDADMEQERILKEYIPGDTVYDLVARKELPPEYPEQVRAMCRLLYPAGLNIDYFPTNFVVCGGKLVYIDYECNPYEEQWDFEHWGVKYWSRTPEFLQHLQEHT